MNHTHERPAPDETLRSQMLAQVSIVEAIGRVLTFAVEAPELRSLSEVESERRAAQEDAE